MTKIIVPLQVAVTLAERAAGEAVGAARAPMAMVVAEEGKKKAATGAVQSCWSSGGRGSGKKRVQ